MNGQAVRWSFFTNHARVLIVVARPQTRMCPSRGYWNSSAEGTGA